MRFLASLAAAGLLLAGCASKPDYTPEPAVTQPLGLSGFNRIDVSRAVTVIYVQDPVYSVVVEAPEGNLQILKTEVTKGELKVSRNSGLVNTTSKPEFFVTVTAPELVALKVDSGAVFQTQAITVPQFDIYVASGAEAYVVDLDAETLSILLDTGSDMSISGTCDRVEAKVKTGAVMMGQDLVCASGRLEASTGGELTISITEAVSTRAAIGATITVDGNPPVRENDKTLTGEVDFQ